MSQFTDFVTKYNGQPVEVEDPTAPDQCMDLAFAWCDFIGVDRATIRHGFAYQIWTQPTDITLQFFDFIPNTPDGVPKEGDIVVFNQSVGVAGHVSIASGQGDSGSFQSFDQNWSGALYAKMVNHVYTSVSGWLHRKDLPVASVDPVILSQSDAFIVICTALGVQPTKDSAIAKIKGLNEQITTLEDNSQSLDRTNKSLMADIVTVKTDLSTAQASNKTLQDNYSASQLALKNDETKMNDMLVKITELQQQVSQPDKSAWQLITLGIKKLLGWG